MPSSSKALLGKAIHKSTAVYDQSTIDKTGITVDEAAGAAVDTIRKPDEEVLFDSEDDAQDMQDIAVALHTKYCKEVAPKQEYVAVEVQCEKIEISDLGIILTGSTDRVGRTDEGFGIRDLKSGGSAVRADGYVETKGAATQIAIYELLAEHGSGVPITAPAKIIGLQTGKTAKGQRVAVSQDIIGAREMLLGDEDSPGLLAIASKIIHSGDFMGNPRSQLCGAKYCPVFNNCRWRK
jgi:hypothetical protein